MCLGWHCKKTNKRWIKFLPIDSKGELYLGWHSEAARIFFRLSLCSIFCFVLVCLHLFLSAASTKTQVFLLKKHLLFTEVFAFDCYFYNTIVL